MTHARVGEHSAVVWKFVYCSPLAASRSNVGVSMSEPKQPNCAKPTSSSSTTSTFGASAGGRTGSGHHGVESRRYRPTTPPNAPHSLIGGRLRVWIEPRREALEEGASLGLERLVGRELARDETSDLREREREHDERQLGQHE